MSIYYSKWGLGTYYVTPYFQACLPKGYPLGRVLQSARAFHRLPPNLRQLSALAKRWAQRKYGHPAGILGMEDYYDKEGHELDPGTGRRLTDQENDALWTSPRPPAGKVQDVPIPAGGFPDPDTWEEPPAAPEEEDRDSPTPEQVLSDVKSRGREMTAAAYGLSREDAAGATSDEAFARLVVSHRRKEGGEN